MAQPNQYTAPRRRNRKWFLIAGGGAVAIGLAAVAMHHDRPKAPPLTADTPASRNALREHQLQSLAGALQAYVSTHGSMPIKLSAAPLEICATTGAACKTAGLVDLGWLADGTTISGLPLDPVGGRGRYGTGYTLALNPATGRAVFAAPRAEQGTHISVAE